MEAQYAVRPTFVDAVEEQRVEVDVQVQRVANALADKTFKQGLRVPVRGVLVNGGEDGL
jgi:hypothetical protein